jgi:predicted aldo/keto reductase-like oxidoreductase
MNEEAHIVENIKTAETALPDSLKPNELAIIEQVADAYRKLLKVPCTGCQYCMPCLNNVNIPRNLQAYNDLYLSGDEQQARAMYAMFLMGGLTGQRSDAAMCKDCQKCIERCPQHINIPEKLKEVAQELGGAKAEAALAAMRANMAASQNKDKRL